MNCPRARELLFAFLDNELEAQANIELQLHLEHCPECAREAEIERQVGRRLATALTRHAPPAEPDIAAIEKELRRADAAASRHPVRPGRILLGAVLVVAAMLVFGFWLDPFGSADAPEGAAVDRSSVDRSQGAPLPFNPTGLVADFEHFVDRGKPLHLAAGDAAQVSQWMDRELHSPVELAATPKPAKLLGARRCESFADRAAFVLYELDGGPAALLVTRAPADMAPGRSVDRLRGHTVLTRRDGEIAYAVVGRQGEAELASLLPAPNRDTEHGTGR